MDRASGVWTVRGVAPGARKLAKAEAAKMGWTLGQWVEQAIERSARLGEREEPVKKSPTTLDKIHEADVVNDEAPETNLTVEELAATPKGRKPRSVCQHGVEKGYNCWQCGGLAVIR